ncbi:CblD like pilus biogenesis initiator [Salmonella enterica]|nr:CblD like pilus biogenesis initiator [Salmonella enterica]VEA96155.1 fimbrial protein TcfD [Salmonella enterica subsp. houtenae]
MKSTRPRSQHDRSCRPSGFGVLLLAALLFPGFSLAAKQDPAARYTPVTQRFDLSSLPGDIPIWISESGGYDSNDPPKWARNSLLCDSTGNPTRGMCEIGRGSWAQWGSTGRSEVSLTFTEERSQQTIVLNLRGYHTIHYNPRSECGEGGHTEYKLYGVGAITCYSGQRASEARFNVWLPGSELARIPFGGVWKADLWLYLTQWSPKKELAIWQAPITLDVTDNRNMQIYFPQFGLASPHVDLGLRPLPGTGSAALMAGQASTDMCLYDGFGSNSGSMELLMRDNSGNANAAGRPPGAFSVYREGASPADPANRLDYTVSMPDILTRQPLTVSNGQTMRWNGTGRAEMRPVRLPSMTHPVMCYPAPLQLQVPPFTTAGKNAGRYTGTLSVIFTPSTNR